MNQKEFKDLTFADDFMFAKVMLNEKLCKQLLEIMVKIKIKSLSYPEEQKVIDPSYDSKSVRLDVYVDDEKGTVYNIEMQTTNPGNIPKRARYYQGMIDLNLIEKGEDYAKLAKSYVIFICMEDIYGIDLGRCTEGCEYGAPVAFGTLLLCYRPHDIKDDRYSKVVTAVDRVKRRCTYEEHRAENDISSIGKDL